MKYLLNIFDVDGTIMDSRASITGAMELTLKRFGKDPGAVDSLSFTGLPLPEAMRLAGIEDAEAGTAVYRGEYFKLQAELEDAYPGVKKAIRRLYNRVLLAVATNKGPNGTERGLKKAGLYDLFDIIVTVEEGLAKPSREVYDLIIRHYAAEGKPLRPEDVLMVGDSPVDVEFAANCGIDSAFIDGTDGWGFFTPADLKAGPTYIISRPEQLLEINEVDKPVTMDITEELDLHTFEPREVKGVVEAYLAEAVKKGYRAVRIAHGKGRGVQKELVRKILEGSPLVSGFHDAPPFLGGFGATIAELKHGEVK